MRDSYYTIKDNAEGLYKDRGSKFLAFALPVKGEDEIREQLEGIRKEYHDARHHCYAWRLGADMESYRVNDDGEPSGTAGKPIFGQIQSKELTHILVVVVRYFGGTKLGTGGLITAYRGATADALSKAEIIECKVKQRIRVEFPYASMNGIMKTAKDFGLDLGDQNFGMECSISLGIWIKHLEAVLNRLEKIDGCKIVYL